MLSLFVISFVDERGWEHTETISASTRESALTKFWRNRAFPDVFVTSVHGSVAEFSTREYIANIVADDE